MVLIARAQKIQRNFSFLTSGNESTMYSVNFTEHWSRLCWIFLYDLLSLSSEVPSNSTPTACRGGTFSQTFNISLAEVEMILYEESAMQFFVRSNMKELMSCGWVIGCIKMDGIAGKSRGEMNG
jgi:hypothetical protein